MVSEGVLSVVAGHDTNLICCSLDRTPDHEAEDQEFESFGRVIFYKSTCFWQAFETAER